MADCETVFPVLPFCGTSDAILPVSPAAVEAVQHRYLHLPVLG